MNNSAVAAVQPTMNNSSRTTTSSSAAVSTAAPLAASFVHNRCSVAPPPYPGKSVPASFPTTTSSSSSGASSSDGKENAERLLSSTKSTGGAGAGAPAQVWLRKLAKVCVRLRSKKRRSEKCEKCGQRSDTCVPNASFISGRKHYLCQDCRVSSDNMKNMYDQLRRNLSLRETSRPASGCSGGGQGGDLSSASNSSSASRSSWSRGPAGKGSRFSEKKAAGGRATGPESGYETATSLDSSCSNGRLSPDPLSTSSGECGRCCTPPLFTSPSSSRYAAQSPPANNASTAANNGCPRHTAAAVSAVSSPKDRSDVFGGASKPSEQARLRQNQPRPKQKVYTRQRPAAPAVAAAAANPESQQPPRQQPVNQRANPTPAAPRQAPRKNATKKNDPGYDGYLEISSPNSQRVKYVFGQRQQQQQQAEAGYEGDEFGDGEGVEAQDDHLGQRRHTVNLKLCYRCQKYRCVAFRAPFGNGWLCEDCIDDLL